MRAAVGIFLLLLFLVVTVYVFVFGGIGALLAPRQARSRLEGFLFGTFLGPIGWLVLVYRRPKGRPRASREVDAGGPVPADVPMDDDNDLSIK
ncbi:MAG: hypothetical protein ACRDZ8_21115 [Acidimicrobiales bacterium]